MSKNSYVLEFLKHEGNRMCAIAFAGAAILSSFPLGLDGPILSALAFVAVEIVGIASIATAPAFKAMVDRKALKAETEKTRDSLLAEIQTSGGSSHLDGYQLMRKRVESLRRTAIDATTTLTESDVDQLDRLTIDYLRLCLSDAVLPSAKSMGDASAGISKKLAAVNERLATPGLSRDEAVQMGRAKDEYNEALQRQARMASRSSVLDASLISIPVRVEELYQMVMTAPTSGELSSMLEESVSRLRFAEKASIDGDELFSLTTPEQAERLSKLLVPPSVAAAAPSTAPSVSTSPKAAAPAAAALSRKAVSGRE